MFSDSLSYDQLLNDILEKISILDLLFDSNFKNYVKWFNNPLKVMFNGRLANSFTNMQIKQIFEEKMKSIDQIKNAIFRKD